MLQTELFLLGNDDKLHKSCDLVVDNSYSIRKRLLVFEMPFLIDLQKECNLRFSERQLESVIRILPVDNQPSFLASVVKEEISRDFIAEESAFALRLERKLHSDEFKFGLMRLAHHRIATSENFNEEAISKALEMLNNINVLGVNKIECYLVFKGNRIQNSERQCPFFVEQEKSEDPKSWNIYIDEKNLKVSYTAEASLYIKLVDIIQSMTGNLPENSVTFVSCMLTCDTNAIDEILDDFGIEQFTGDIRFRRDFRSPGQFLPLHLHCYLNLDVLHLNPGEFAALEVDDPLDRLHCREDLDNSVWPTFLVVKIVEVIGKESEPFLTVYRVESGSDEFMTGSADVLYAFDLTADGTKETGHSSNADGSEMSLDDVKKIIRVAFESIGNLPAERRTKMVKRLLLRWHPDRNSESNRQMCIDAEKYIWELEESMEQSNMASEGSQPLFTIALRVTETEENVIWTTRKLYEACLSFRVKEHKKFKEQPARLAGRQYPDDAGCSKERESDHHLNGELNPQPGFGRNLLLQAELDFKAARNDVSRKERACQKYYQVGPM